MARTTDARVYRVSLVRARNSRCVRRCSPILRRSDCKRYSKSISVVSGFSRTLVGSSAGAAEAWLKPGTTADDATLRSVSVATFLTPLLRAPSARLRLENSRNGRIVAEDLWTAFDSATRRRGLLGRDSMPEGSALIIAPCSSIHTFFMRFPIDIAFVARDGRVVSVRTALPAWRIALALRAYAVVEFPAGALARSETMAGDVLIVRAGEIGSQA
jgi:uncharacterized membrane protein (UPF0127 family)